MIEAVADLWTIKADVRCITTNGIVKSDGRAVMGRGVALQARNRFPDIDLALGKSIRVWGNHVMPIWPNADRTEWIVSFPVKEHWRDKADLALIARSCEELTEWVDFCEWETILLPRPGCGAGGLRWDTVKPVLQLKLDDRFLVIDR